MLKPPRTVRQADVLVDGRRIHYLRAGSGPPLILVHGLIGSLRNWRLNLDALAEAATVYALDLHNMGQSDRVPGLDPSLEATADRLFAVMDALGLAQADVAGHSHGGAVALALAARCPERVRRLILFAPANPFCHQAHHLIRFYAGRPGRLLAHLIPHLPRWTAAIALRRMYGNPSRIRPGALEGYTAGLRVRGTVDHVTRILRLWDSDMAHLRSTLPAVAGTPTLLIWGDADRAVGLGSARKLHRLLPRSTLLILPGVGHIPFEEMPEPCNRAMLDFLAKPAPASPPPRPPTCLVTAGSGLLPEPKAIPQPTPDRLLHHPELPPR